MINLQEKIEKTLLDDPYDFTKDLVDGVPLFYKNFPSAPCIHIRIAFRFGAKHDPIGKEGVAHLLEHMIFKGTDIYETEKDIEYFRKNITLGTLNAYTGMFEMVVKAKCLPYNFEKCLKGMMSIVVMPKLRDEDFAVEKKIVMDEAWRHFKNEKQIAYTKKIRNTHLSDLPDRLRIVSALGWPDTIKKIENTDVKATHKKYIIKENVVFFIAGNLDTVGGLDNIKSILNTHILKLSHGNPADFPYIPGELTLPTTPIFDTTYTDAGMTDKKQSSINLSYNFPREKKENGALTSINEEQTIAKLSLATRLIDDVVYEKLRMDKGWCYSAGSSYTVEPEFLRLSLGADLNPEHTEEAVDICKDIIENLKQGHYKDKFDQVKTLAIESNLSSERLTGDIISGAVDDFLSENQTITMKKALLLGNAVTFENVVEFVNTYITPDRLFIEILRPDPEKKSAFAKIKSLLFRK